MKNPILILCCCVLVVMQFPHTRSQEQCSYDASVNYCKKGCPKNLSPECWLYKPNRNQNFYFQNNCIACAFKNCCHRGKGVWSSRDGNFKKLSSEYCPNKTIVTYPYDQQCRLLRKAILPVAGNEAKINRPFFEG